MKKFIHIGGDSRTGGSLFARLFDAHPNILSYPFENEIFTDRNHELINFKDYSETHQFADVEKMEVVNKIKKFAKEVLTSKQFYDEDSVNFNYEEFTKLLIERIEEKQSSVNDVSIFDAIHYTFFQEFNPSVKYKNVDAVCNHCSRTFLANMNSFFITFKNGYFLHTIRDAKSVCASMKNYSFVVSGKTAQNLPKNFIENVLDRWLLALYVGLKNENHYVDKYILVSYGKLVKDPVTYLEWLCNKLKIQFNQEMLTPKFGNTTWSGNSSFGKLPSKISSNSLYKYKNVLSKKEIQFIDSEIKEIETIFDYKEYEILNEMVKEKMNERLPNVLNMDCSEIRNHFNKIHNEMRNIQLNA